jgi:glycosyltransferase involved in cell wall biosynthesis
MTSVGESILILSGVRGDTRRYRTFHLFEQTCLLGLDSKLSHVVDREFRKKVEQASIIILHRAIYNKQISWLEREVHQRNGILIQDIDDLLFEPESFDYIDSIDFSDPRRASLYKTEMLMYRQTLEVCDAVITSTDYLANQVSKFSKPVRVHRNAFSLEMLELSENAFKSRQTRSKKIVIGYASGTATHNQDFAQIQPALQSILRRHSNSELWLIGPVDPGTGWENLANQIKRFKLVSWRELPKLQAQFDINLAPLRTDNPFSQSKSEIKYIEAALLHIPTIASPSDAYSYAIQHKQNGILANDAKEWEDNLDELISQPNFRSFLGENAFQATMQNDHPQVRANQFKDSLEILTGRKKDLKHETNEDNHHNKGSGTPYWSSKQAEKTPSLLQMSIYSVQNRGFQVLFQQVQIYIRRLISPIFPYRNYHK